MTVTRPQYTLHPFDPNVVITYTIEDLKLLLRERDVHAAILQQPFGKEQPKVRSAFQSIWDRAQEQGNQQHPDNAKEAADARNKILKHWFNLLSSEEGKFEPRNFPAVYETVWPYLERIALGFQEIRVENYLTMEVFPNYKTPRYHSHRFHVMNCPQINRGAAWQSPDGIERSVDEGDWIVMKPGFKHTSSDGDRVTVIVGRSEGADPTL